MFIVMFGLFSILNFFVIIVSFISLTVGGTMLAFGVRRIRARFNLVISVLTMVVVGAGAFIVGIVILVVVILPNSQAYKSLNKSYNDGQQFSWIQLIKPLPKVSEVTGGLTLQPFEGGLNGINLMLINNITTDNYVKQWLTIAADAQEGKLDKYKTHISVGTLLGTAMAEQGPYAGTPIPTSMFAWNNTTHSPTQWSVGGGADLEQAGRNMFQPGGGAIQPLGRNEYSGKGSYIGPFQETPNQFGNSGDTTNIYSSPPSMKYSPKGESHANADDWFFPDQVVNMDMYWSQAASEVPGWDSLNNQEKAFWLSIDMNAGPEIAEIGSRQIPNGSKLIPDNLIKAFKPYQHILLKGLGTDTNTYRCLMMYAASKNGWQLTTEGSSYVLRQSNPTTSKYYSVFGKNMGVSIAQWKSQVGKNQYGGAVPGIGRSSYGGVTTTINGKRVFFSYIALTHAMITMFTGDPEYAVMLQYAGVKGVDPDNTNTYYNHIKEKNPNAWMPPSDASGWQKVLNYPSEANPVATAVINYGMQWLRLPYSEQCRPTDLQTKEISDCSAFMWWIIKQVTGKSISPRGDWAATSTEYQMFSPIPLSQAQPGDLIFFGEPPYQHVGMVVSGNSLSTLIILNTAQNKAGANVYGPSYGIKWDINDFGNYQVYDLQPFYKSCQIHQTQPVPHFPARPWNSSNPYMMGLKAAGYGQN